MAGSRLSTTRGTVVRALEAGHVSVVFQPIVDVRNGHIFAYEALARSRAETLDSPPKLFDAAVEQRQCGRLGRALREMAVAGCAHYPLFLNVHPHELADRWLVQPDDPIFAHEHEVYLEVTESVPLSHHELVKGILGEVRSKGVGLVVDDLGAGYSNLRYIADLAPEVVKLDRGLVEGLHRDPRRQRLVASIVRLCTDLEARVVAEGIEELEELSAVRDAGVQYVQGYLIARPAFPAPRPDEDVIPVSRHHRRSAHPAAAFANRLPTGQNPLTSSFPPGRTSLGPPPGDGASRVTSKPPEEVVARPRRRSRELKGVR